MTSTQLVVVGGGPGGYAAAFLAADLGLSVALVDPEAEPRRRLRLSRLHSVEGAAARRQAPRRGAPREGVGRRVRRAEDRSRQAARVQEQRRQAADERHRPARQASQGAATSRASPRSSMPHTLRVKLTAGGEETLHVRARDSRDRLDAGDAADAEGRRSARDGFDRGARSARHPEVAARRRRRLHRPRARHRSTPRSAAPSPSSR